MADTLTLIAISLTGTTLIVLDDCGQTWLHASQPDRRPELIAPTRAEEMIEQLSLERLDRPFADAGALESFRAEHARRASEGLTFPIAALATGDIEALVDAAGELVERGEHERATPLLLRLRTAPALERGTPLYARLVGLIERDPAFDEG